MMTKRDLQNIKELKEGRFSYKLPDWYRIHPTELKFKVIDYGTATELEKIFYDAQQGKLLNHTDEELAYFCRNVIRSADGIYHMAKNRRSRMKRKAQTR